MKNKKAIGLFLSKNHISTPLHKMSSEIFDEINSKRFRIVIFGSARVKPDDQIYQNVFNLAKRLGEAGHDVITGGGPGVMEAANLGHRAGTPEKDNPARSIGLNIRLPMEQYDNKGLDLQETHDRFSTRLDEFMLLSNIVVVADGGIGTLLELFYTWQLIQVKHISRMPIVLMGPMWRGLTDWIKKEPLSKNYLNKEDLSFVIHADNSDEAFEVVQSTYEVHSRLGDKMCITPSMYGK
ncbi:MAG: hypothetical protein UR28_C0011G0005 [Candidatus Peregrinibacteria bacterium GW2011_GWF2_33_10]|nr:MAG: hypothetical protein UR28_C0011G0005 [Candidatus Peregrinibacteria bacterium GW2011_GWF2_33_10]OGJ44282.1 MAG: hypothetical protein A2272_05475 [Candidatus Peregrinibacteria bacterium RIFOXYA12_FULL_33_12]OGJ44657.1 MAG: hypothetical protein A2263_00915 [Candidatus Peregrinibacteria bacterium RIFOXYA2_FULL_33_21]OGJ50391.1 MAG: hypothetical protein A2307_05975 [Candidatus Peregrinibacteria bacterium RIFOXYB2_FULL_33_20]